MMLGEITPFFIALLVGFVLGTQLSGQLSRRGTYFILGITVIAAFLFEAPIYTSSIFGGFITSEISFATPLIGATIGLLIGKYVGGGK